ncbi:hypothetical protein AWB80_08163 [Caballeronia pedi]|uniref:Uncharacterized protein n=1 Tax=Caballeronia pedi TaxID=1777141 RepID=A0A158E497_9BURK|nr:hypothetical protein [Caballeronia pedi]SAL01603.1 hypothetical protein AWB80_08163 [Caballeronia pedi]
MTREPVIVNGKLTGHNVRAPASYIKVRDDRGYESVMMLRPAETVFEPVKAQSSLIEEDQ